MPPAVTTARRVWWWLPAAEAQHSNLKPMAILRGHASSGVSPEIMGIGPVPSLRKAVEIGLRMSDLGLIELNEAFAAQSLAVMKALELDPAIVNVNGGAIALGHPLGCSGARILTTLIYEMKRRGVKYGAATLCIAGGRGLPASSNSSSALSGFQGFRSTRFSSSERTSCHLSKILTRVCSLSNSAISGGTACTSYPGQADVKMHRAVKFAEHGVLAWRINTVLHTGTHMNAPINMIQRGADLSEIPVDRFFGSGVVLSIPKEAYGLITAADLEAAQPGVA